MQVYTAFFNTTPTWTNAGVLLQIHKRGEDQLPKKHLRVDILKWQMWRCRWRSTSYCRDAYKFKSFLNFLFRRQRGVDWCQWNATQAHEMSIAKKQNEIAMWACAGPTLSQELRLNRQKLRWNCGFTSACWTLVARRARQPSEIMQEYACVKNIRI